MTDVITGANGHIGANLVRRLLSENHSCRALIHKNSKALEGLDVERCSADIMNPESLVKAFQDADVVYHLAGIISLASGRSDKTYKINVEGTRNVVEACIRTKVRRLVHFSSIQAFSRKPENESLDETRCLVESKGAMAYDLSKATAIGEVRRGIDEGLDAIILHPTAVIGPYDFEPSHMGKTMLSLSRRRVITVVEGGFNWVDARDVAAGAVAARDRGRTGQSYILGGHWLSLKNLADSIQKIAGINGLVLVAPKWVGEMAAPIAEIITKLTGTKPRFTKDTLSILNSFKDISLDKARLKLGYRPRPLMKTFEDTFQWFSNSSIF